MNFQFYLEKLYDSEEYQKFKKENPSAYLCSGFFSIDRKLPKKDSKPDNQQHLDYFIPELNKMFSFKMHLNPIELMPVENFNNTQNPENKEKFQISRIKDNLDFDFNEIERIIQNKINEEKIKNKVEKILWSIQNNSNKTFLVGTIFLSNLGMIKILFNIDDKKIENFEKKSFFDFIKIMKK